jgi:signal transduction histidine kinase
VTQFGRERNQSTIDGGVVRENERFGFFAHELRNLLHTATIAFEVVKTGNVGVGGSTGIVLQRSLAGARTLIDRSLAEIRLTQGIQHREMFFVDHFIADIVLSARLASDARAINLTVLPVESGVAIEADRLALAAAVSNVLQNGFKFTRSQSTVVLRVRVTDDRVLIEVQDECGGLPVSDTDELFRPFEQRGADRTGIGLGLAYCRWAVEANLGRIYARTTSGEGCVFTIDMPRASVGKAAAVAVDVT